MYRSLVHPNRVQNGAHVISSLFKTKARQVLIGQPAATLIVPDKRVAFRKGLDFGPAIRVVPFHLQMAGKIDRAQQHRSAPVDRIGQLGTVGGGRIADTRGFIAPV